jgi:hypothetical protein
VKTRAPGHSTFVPQSPRSRAGRQRPWRCPAPLRHALEPEREREAREKGESRREVGEKDRRDKDDVKTKRYGPNARVKNSNFAQARAHIRMSGLMILMLLCG